MAKILAKLKKTKFKYIYIALGMFAVAFLLGSCLVLPLFDRKLGVFDEKTGLLGVTPIGDEINNTPAYIYEHFIPPENSFGIGETTFKTVNWSYFKQLFSNHFYKHATYKRYSYSDWQVGSEYVGIEKNWNDTGFWKINITLDIPVDLYEVNISFGCDLPVLDYVERDDTEIWINYTANATENYSVVFNWSDIKEIQGLSITKHHWNNIFYISLHRNNVPSGFYVFDPTFGDTSTYSSTSQLKDYIKGLYCSPSSSGTVDSITITKTLGWWGSVEAVKCAIYDSDSELIAETEELEGNPNGDNSQYPVTFDFSEPKPSVVADTYYIITAWAGGGNGLMIYRNSGSGYRYKEESYDGSYPSSVSFSSASYTWSIYATYTEDAGTSNNNPSLQNETPIDGATGISSTPDLFVMCNDSDGDTMNATWYSNSSGSWVMFATNGTISEDTNITQTNSNFSGYNTKYWWAVNLSDGMDGYTNTTFSFTTRVIKWNNPFYWDFSYSNTSSYQQKTWWDYSYSNISNYKQPFWWDFSYSRTSQYNNPFYWDFSYSRESEYNTPYWWDFSYSNISSYQQEYWWTFSYSRESEYNTPFYWDFSYSYIACNKPAYYWTFSYSNTSNYQEPYDWDFSYSNISWYHIPFGWNFSYKNIAQYHSLYDWSFSYSNVTKQRSGFWWDMAYSNISNYKNALWWTYGYSNTTSWLSGYNWDISYSNTSSHQPKLWWDYSYSNTASYHNSYYWSFSYSYINTSKTAYYWDISYSNSTPVSYIIITSVYPANNSNEIPLQPNMYATFNHIYGETMNITWYCNDIVLGYDINITNSTNFELCYPASGYATSYTWNLSVNDGVEYLNESYIFTTEGNVKLLPSSNYAVIGIVGVIGLIGFIFFLIKPKRRKKY